MSSEFVFDTNSDKTIPLYKLRAPPNSSAPLTTHHHYHYHQAGGHKSTSTTLRTSAEEHKQENLAELFFNDSSSTTTRPGIKLIPYKFTAATDTTSSSFDSLSDLSLDGSSASSSSASNFFKTCQPSTSSSTRPGLWSKLRHKMRTNISKFSFMFTFFFTWIAIFVLYQSGFLFASESTFFKTIRPLFPDHVYEIPFHSSLNPSLASAFILNNPAVTNLDSCHRNLVDIHDGSLAYLHHAIEFNQHVFIYLYAHWDARSIFFSSLVKELACRYSSPNNPILFLTVNCFNPNGECRKYFNLIKYPQVVFQVRSSGIFSYKGPMKLNYVSEFIDRLMAPIKRLDSSDELVDFAIENQAVVIANLNVNIPQENDLYKTFYLSALKAISSNSENPIRYGLVLNQTVWQQIVTDFQQPVVERQRSCQSLRFHSINSTNATGDDSLDNKIMIFDMFGYKKTLKNANRTTVDSLTSWAQNNLKKAVDWSFPDRDGPLVKARSGRPDLLVFTEKNSKLEDLLKYLIIEDWIANSKNAAGKSSCQFHSKVVNQLRQRLESVLGEEETLLTKDGECWSAAFNSVFAKNLESSEQVCRKEWNSIYRPFNGSIQIDLLDKSIYLNYARGLLHESKHSLDQEGANPTSTSEPVVILVDYEHENLNLLEKRVDYKNLKEFIVGNKKIANLKNRHIRIKEVVNQSNQIEEINTTQMVSIFSKETPAPLYFEKDLLIFYFNTWCGFCKTASFMLNDVMYRYLRNCPSFKLVEIDTDSNDLPWSLHAQHLPAILYKPAGTRETTFFSYDQRFTIKDLLNFILHNAGDAQTLKCYLEENVLKSLNGPELRASLLSIVDQKITTLGRKLERYAGKLEQMQTDMGRVETSHGLSNHSISRAYLSLSKQLYFHTKHLNLVKDFKSLFD